MESRALNCQVYEDGLALADARLPAGTWAIVTDDDKILVSGLDFVAVDQMGIALGIDMQQVTVKQMPTHEEHFGEEGIQFE